MVGIDESGDLEQNAPEPCKIFGRKDDLTENNEPKKQGVTISTAMDEAVILDTAENPYYAGVRISQLEVSYT